MQLVRSLLSKLGLHTTTAARHPIRVFLLEDDERRHQWFASRFKGDVIDVADNVGRARELLSTNNYDAIFLDHDLHPEHYESSTPDDERTGYAIALWLASNPELQRASTILVHTRNADGAMRMVEELRRAGRAVEFVPFPMLEERIKHYWKR
jgi:CheY-like chemotaxis protein